MSVQLLSRDTDLDLDLEGLSEQWDKGQIEATSTCRCTQVKC